jgi:hypothetical protein
MNKVIIDARQLDFTDDEAMVKFHQAKNTLELNSIKRDHILVQRRFCKAEIAAEPSGDKTPLMLYWVRWQHFLIDGINCRSQGQPHVYGFVNA